MEYTYLMRIGQPKLPERETQRSGLVVKPTSQQKLNMVRVED
jgi:hypothetical protein